MPVYANIQLRGPYSKFYISRET